MGFRHKTTGSYGETRERSRGTQGWADPQSTQDSTGREGAERGCGAPPAQPLLPRPVRAHSVPEESCPESGHRTLGRDGEGCQDRLTGWKRCAPETEAGTPSLLSPRPTDGGCPPPPPTHLLWGCSRLCRYIKLTSNRLMSLHLKSGAQGTVSGLHPGVPQHQPQKRGCCLPASPLPAGGQLPGLALLQLVVHFGSFVIQPLEVPTGPLEGHFRLDAAGDRGGLLSLGRADGGGEMPVALPGLQGTGRP